MTSHQTVDIPKVLRKTGIFDGLTFKQLQAPLKYNGRCNGPCAAVG